MTNPPDPSVTEAMIEAAHDQFLPSRAPCNDDQLRAIYLAMNGAAISSMPSLEAIRLIERAKEWLNTGRHDDAKTALNRAIASLTRKDGSEGVEVLCKRVFLHGYSDGWRGNQLGRDAFPKASETAWSFYVSDGALQKSIAAALTSTREGLTGGEVCRCSEEARTNRVAARMGASFEEAGDD